MTHDVLAILVMALVTALLRFAPFLIFGGKQTPAVITYLGKVLPFAIMGMLAVYCMKDVSFASYTTVLPPLIASAAVVGMHLWKRNTLLSIVGGTVLYMVLVQLGF